MTNPEKTSKVIIQIELECDSCELLSNLQNLLSDLHKAERGTNELYKETKTKLESLLELAISKIELKGPNEGTIQAEPIPPFNGWGCMIILSTMPLPPLPHICD